MTLSVVKGETDKPAASEQLARALQNRPAITGDLFIGYPIVGTADGPYVIDAILFSPERGIVIFDLVEGIDLGDYRVRQDDAVNKLDARLRTYPNLMSRRSLKIDVHVLTYAPAVATAQKDDDYPVATDDSVASIVSGLGWPDRSDDVYRAALSAVENISAIRRPRQKRRVHLPTSRGAKLASLENTISTLDRAQSHAVIETAEGIQRIRGLAGSGKTIVLALKAAYLHALHPDWRIAVTFNTRSLKGQFRHLIHNFVLEQTRQEPDWDNLRIISAWGGRGSAEREGVYLEFCRLHGVDFLTYKQAYQRFPRTTLNTDAFAGACNHALAQARELRPAYDAILVDEAQDFPAAFLRLCFALLKQPKRLIYAYDELQSLTGLSLPSPQEIFRPHADDPDDLEFPDFGRGLGRDDIILDRCYRNSRPVLTTAHALGFGIYHKPVAEGRSGLIQMFDQPTLWTETGYKVAAGRLADGQHVTLRRNEATSPKFLESHSSVDDLVQFHTFETTEEQNAWLVDAIEANLKDDELHHRDIMVINPKPRTTRDNVGPVRQRLYEMEISSHLAGVDTDPDIFFRNDVESITFTGVHRAKGNEAGMVYILNAHDCHSDARNLATLRNQLFTAITRSKAWIRVLGVGPNMEAIRNEYEALKARDFALAFTYPTADERQHLRIVHRDMTEAESKQLKAGQRQLLDVVTSLESGTIQPDDLDPAIVSRLKDLLPR